ncbi:MAG: TlpA disulfide reductase family protein [Polyangiaceae bacterium]
MTLRRLAVVVAAALAVSCQAAAVPSRSAPGTGSSTGTRAPDFTARDTDGNTFRLSDHLGKQVVLLDFWSTYCEPCKAEFPHLRAMYDRDKARGLLVVGVAMDGPETLADVPAFVKRFDVNFPVVVDDDSRIASLYNPKKSMPLSVIIDRAGRIAVVREGYNPGDERQVASDVTAALSSGGSTP